jgi:F-type H+-transporting ATPase subunit b
MLNLNIPTIVWEVINFLVLTGLLYFLLFKPIQRRVNQRAEEKREQKEELNRQLAQVEDLRSELDERLENVDEQVEEVLSEARERMKKIRQSTVDNARQEAEQILKAASQEAVQLQEKAVTDHMDEVMDVIREVSQRVIRETTTDKVHDQLVQDLNDRIWQLGSGEMDQVEAIRRSLDERSPTVFVESARPLEDGQVKELRETLSALIDQEVDLETRTEPELISGLRVRVGDTLINSTLAAKLDKILDQASESIREKLEHV